jgi:hypothetical protein
MKTYAVRAARSKMTGHYRRPGTRDLYCARPAGAPNGEFATLRGWKMCARCVKAEAADRAAATATAEAWLDTPPASTPTPAALALRAQVEYIDARRAEVVERRRVHDEREAVGTWRSEWIGARARSTAPTLFDVDPDTEQGALFT